MILQADGKIVFAGRTYNGTNYDFALVRYNNTITTTVTPQESNSDIKISPNPSSGLFTLQSTEEITVLEIYNVLGEKVYKSEMQNLKYEINLSAQAKGIYFVRVQSGENVSTQKIIIE